MKYSKGLVWFATLTLILGALVGCSTLQFYQQAALGQWQLLQARKSIAMVLADDNLSDDLHDQLELAQEILVYAESNLGLKSAGRYKSYVDLRRPYVVWNVFAAPALDVQGHSWCYPFIGCAPYRGYFKHTAAVKQAQRLQKQGFETYVGGVPAYSTLGWFDDPLLNTFVHWPAPELANLLIHELSHSRVWLASEVAFNESFANFVGQQGSREWMLAKNSKDEWQAWRGQQRSWRRFRTFLLQAKHLLTEIYAEAVPQAVRMGNKSVALKDIRNCYEINKAMLGDGRWDKIIYQDLNNAFLVSLGTYEDFLPGFAALFRQHKDNWEDFFQAVENIAELEPRERQAMLYALGQQQETTHTNHNNTNQVQCNAFASHGTHTKTPG